MPNVLFSYWHPVLFTLDYIDFSIILTSKPFPFSPFHHLLFATLNFHHLIIFVCFSWQFEIAGLNCTCNIFSYNMASSVSGQNESNPALWLANRAGKMDLQLYLACLGLPAMPSKKTFPESDIINTLLTKLVQSRWLDIGLVPFLQLY